jgi:hypothetical protein
MKFLDVVDSEIKSNQIYLLFAALNLLLSILCLFSEITLLGISGFIFNIVLTLFNILPNYKRLPGALYFSFILELYFAIPIAWICLNRNYDFTINFITPLQNTSYQQVAPDAILYLILTISLLIFGAIFFYKDLKITHKPSRYSINILLVIFISILIINIFDNMRMISYYGSRFTNTSKYEYSIVEFIFNDTAFQIYFSCLFFLIINKPNDLSKRWNIGIYLLVFLSYVSVGMLASSKGAVLIVFINLFLYPLSLSRINKYIYWPSNNAFIILIIISVIIFIISRGYRQSLGILEGDIVSNTIMNIINSSSQDNYLLFYVDIILHRLSSTVNNFIVIYKHFGGYYNYDYSISVVTYMIKSFLNLILPGTPYMESYFTTSNMLPEILEKSKLLGYGDSSTFWLKSNSQSYTIIGVFLIIFGPILTLPIIFFSGVLYSILSRISANVFYRAWILFAFTLIFISYGFENSLQTAIHFSLSFFCITSLFYLFKFVKKYND